MAHKAAQSRVEVALLLEYRDAVVAAEERDQARSAVSVFGATSCSR